MPVFAFTDIEGSTGLWERHQSAMGPIIARHYAILEKRVAAQGGSIIKKTGDGIFALFPDETPGTPSPALTCGLQMQHDFQEEAWPVIGELRVRMAFHSGQAEEMGGDYYGPTANRTARFMSLGWGGQILVSEELRKQATLPEGAQWQDLGLHQVKDLPEPQQVYGLLHPKLKLHDFPALKSLSSRPTNLPENVAPIAGRRRELNELSALLQGPRSRVVTLVGGAGVGKSRLALQAALELLEHFKHGAYRVKLDSLSEAGQLPERIAGSLKLGLYRQQDVREQLTDYLRNKQVLLVLDPCERVAGAAAWLTELLEASPSLRVLACSRRRLNLQDEAVLRLQGLDYPAEVTPEGFSSGGAARFFVQQVQAFNPTYSLKPADQAAFLRICRALRGLPLGLELAAPYLRSLPMQALAEKLEQDPRFLTSTRQDLPEAHRSLTAVFESTWSVLSEAEQAVTARLSVFVAAFTAPAAQRVAQAQPEALANLLDAGLLERADGDRYALPPAMRYLAALKLESDPARQTEALDAHARFYGRFAHEHERGLNGYGQAAAVDAMVTCFADVQRAWDRAVERGMLGELAQAAKAVGLYTDLRGLARDWEGRMERALKLWEEATLKAAPGAAKQEAMAVQAQLLANQANLLFSLGHSGGARERMEKCLSLARKAAKHAIAAYALVRMAVFLGPEDERRQPALEEAANLYQSLNDANGVAWARRHSGYLLCLQGRAAEGRPLLAESLSVFRQIGNQREIGWSVNSLAQAALESGDYEAGMLGLREARDIFLGLGDLETAAWTLNRAGRAAMKHGQWDAARETLEESLQHFGQTRNVRGRAQSLRSLCEIFAGQGNLTSAFSVVDRAIGEAQENKDLGGQAGAQMQKSQLLAGAGRYEEALELIQAAQNAFTKIGSELGSALAMESQATVLTRHGDAVTARRLYNTAMGIFAQAGLRDGEARLCARLGDLDVAEGKPDGGEAQYRKALKLSYQSKPGDYSLGGLLGLAGVYLKAGRKLEALNLALVAERMLALGILPASESEYYAELGPKSETMLSQIGSKLLMSVIEDTRVKLRKGDARAQLKECVEKNWS